jgi:hypothetical protein
MKVMQQKMIRAFHAEEKTQSSTALQRFCNKVTASQLAEILKTRLCFERARLHSLVKNLHKPSCGQAL